MKPRNDWRWLSVDPGLGGTGWALWRGPTMRDGGIFNAPSKGSVVDRAWRIAHQVHELVARRRVGMVACEWPAYHGSSAAGEMVARRGDLVKLSYLVGVIGGAVAPVEFIPVEVMKWKGQLPKEVIEQRVTQRLGAGTVEAFSIRSHMFDAVGIGLYLLGRL